MGSVIVCLLLSACTNAAGTGASANAERTATLSSDLLVSVSRGSVSTEFLDLQILPAGIAAGRSVVFIGDPLEGRVLAFSRFTGKPVGELPQPPGGFSIPFIMHQLADGSVAILCAGGLPQINPFVPAQPFISVYSYSLSPISGFSASLDRNISFSQELVGFPEDFAQTDDGRILMTDSVLGSIWVAQTDGTITPGIVPKTFDPQDAIPAMVLCPTMPEVTVNGVPFLFTGSTIPGIEPITIRNGTVYFHSSCARGIFTFPLSILSDNRQPYQRAADITLLASTPPDIQVEELLEMQFNPFDRDDPMMYAAHGMQLEIIRVDSRTGAREVVAHDPRLFDFPSSLAFLPPIGGFETGLTSFMVVSNQQERTPITNDAATQDSFNVPFLVAKVLVRP
jgi:hypothetical protein